MSRPKLARAALGLIVAAQLGACDKATILLEQPDDAPVPAAAPASPLEDPLVIHAQIREVVREYASALDKREAERARERVVTETFAYYEDLRVAALRATREQLEAWDLMSVLLILQIRSTLSREQLEALDGTGLFERAVREGLVGNEAASIPLDDVWLDEAGERAEIRIDGEPVVWLRLEQDWRVDIPEMIRALGPAIEALARARVIADGKVWTALTLLEQSGDTTLEVVDGPLEHIEGPTLDCGETDADGQCDDSSR